MAERKSHVVRLYKDDDTTSDVWIDIERLDELSFKSGRAYHYRQKRWKFDWDNFRPDGRNVTKKKIVDPNDKENFIEVPIRDSVFVEEAKGGQFQGRRHKFANGSSNKRRKTHSRRVHHHDIPEENLDAKGQPPSDPKEYLNSLRDQDMEQHVDVELLDQYWSDENEKNDAQGRPKIGTWQGKKWVPNPNDTDLLLRDPILDTDEIDPDFVPTNNPEDGPTVDPPWRLDPLQNIVNISWGGGGLAVEFYAEGETPPEEGEDGSGGGL